MSAITLKYAALIFFMVTAKFKNTEVDILSLAYARNADTVERMEQE